ncbi:MAG TPA: hypothetical protein VNL77_19815, partial [Roseiflexaceae bacterium]|nr:hypothetical protein [Roseiflexaceae bacterium]
MRAGWLSTLWVCCVLAGALLVGGRMAAPARAATEALYVPATGHYMRGVFRDFWEKHGGLANFGYPITEEYVEPGTGRILQYFERARFERALPSSTTVQLGLLGREVLGERPFPPAERAQQHPLPRRLVRVVLEARALEILHRAHHAVVGGLGDLAAQRQAEDRQPTASLPDLLEAVLDDLPRLWEVAA